MYTDAHLPTHSPHVPSDRVSVNFISTVLELHSYTRFLTEVVRSSIREDPNLERSMSSEKLARIVSQSDLRALHQQAAPKSNRYRSKGGQTTW